MEEEMTWQEHALKNGVHATRVKRRERLLDRLHDATQEMVVALDEYARWMELALQYDERAREFARTHDVERVFDARQAWDRTAQDLHEDLASAKYATFVRRREES